MKDIQRLCMFYGKLPEAAIMLLVGLWSLWEYCSDVRSIHLWQ